MIPSFLGRSRVLAAASVAGRTVTNQVQFLNGAPLSGAKWLVAATFADAGDSSVYLYHCDDDFLELTDTQHIDLDDAKAQAAYEYGEGLNWIDPPRTP
jgi:hypothetical protein